MRQATGSFDDGIVDERELVAFRDAGPLDAEMPSCEGGPTGSSGCPDHHPRVGSSR